MLRDVLAYVFLLFFSLLMSFLRLFGCFPYFCWLLFPCIFLCFPKSITHLNGAGSAIPLVQCEMVADRAMVTVDTCGVGVGVFKGKGVTGEP